MFKELAPLLRHRAVLFTVTYVEEDQFRVDRELPQTLLHFVSSHLELQNTLERAKAGIEEASKAARAEARKKLGSQATKKDPVELPSKPATTQEAPALVKAETPKAASLFDSEPEPARVSEGNVLGSTGTQPPYAPSESDEDEEILRETYAEVETEEGDEAA